MSEPVKLTPKMIDGAKSRLVDVNAAQAILESYVKGCMDALGLDGDWSLNTSTWSLTKVEEVAK